MDYQNMTAPCGLDCLMCPIYLANTDEKLREMIATQLNVPIEKAVCHGCRNQAGIITALGSNAPCYIYQCIEEKGISLCCDCPDFPWEYLHPYDCQCDQARTIPKCLAVF